ncbi:glycosyltransferase family A protein [Chloroflexus sp.]|uniref:glycosyltransferase family A protein n=1 Tax=Chloroflexus sp. TaxID=1904827 RepID=UPI002FD94D67
MAATITVAIPVYKRLTYVAQAIRSVAAQDYPAIELIVSDNGCNGDAVLNLVRANYPRPFIFRQNPVSVPIVPHFNQLLAAASGNYFVLLSDDDELAPGYLSTMVAALEAHPDAAAAISRVEVLDEQNRVVGSTADRPLPPSVMSGPDWIARWGRNEHKFVCFTTNLARAAELRAVGGYPNFDGGNGVDNALLVALSIDRSIVYCHRAIFRHRIYDTSFGKSVSVTSLARASRQFLAFLDQHPKLRAYARQYPQEWAACRAAITRVIWTTYYGRWRQLYRGREHYLAWLKAGFALPFIPAYYRRVLPEIVYSLPAVGAFARRRLAAR